MKTRVWIRYIVGRCASCDAPILDAGWTDDPFGWVHSLPIVHPDLGVFQNAAAIHSYYTMSLSRFP